MTDPRDRIKNHWEVFSAWLNGADVEYFSQGKWRLTMEPSFLLNTEYRVAKGVEEAVDRENEPLALSRDGIRKHYDVFMKWMNGAEVEFYSCHLGRWEPTGSPVFCPELEYRASEQIVAWVNVFDDGTVEFFMSEEDARKYSEDAVRVGVKVREVR